MKKQPLINPFENYRVSEPRHIEKSVTRLNDKPLEELLRQFEILEKDTVPRKGKLARAQFVTSPQPGYGKSHLIGRLFRKLNQRATLVYLHPFEDPATCWKNILLKTVQELDFPDKAESSEGGEPTQLEAFAHGIISHLVAGAVDSGKILVKNKKTSLNYLHNTPIQKIRQNNNWLDWLRKNNSEMANQCFQQIQQNEIRLNASPFSWIGVLLTCAYFPSRLDLRETCLDWLKGGSVDPDEAAQIGIRKADMPDADMGSGAVNELCKQRIADFCQLAGFFRPFVFCFDQTENYGKEIVLAKTFGLVIQVLTDEICNHMTVVTANQDPWSKNIQPWWETAHQNRLSIPLELEGLNKSQAIELIDQRFDFLNTESEKNLFLDDKQWLDELFGQTSEFGIRKFLEHCNNRWHLLNPNGGGVSPDHIEECYRKNREKIEDQPKRLVFDPDIFLWLVREAAAGLPDLSVEKYKSQKGYFTLVWKLKDQEILFGFESGSNWKRWEAICREAKIHYEVGPRTKAVFFRTPELPEIPGKWGIAGKIEAAKKQFLHIIQLQQSDLSGLYAGYDLYMDSVEGNIRFQRHEVLSFIREQFSEFWNRIQQPLNNGNGPTDGLVEEIRNLFQKEKVMDADQLIKRLSEPVSKELLHEALTRIPEIKVHVSPTTTVLQWQSNLST
jgi:hypothetical protein